MGRTSSLLSGRLQQHYRHRIEPTIGGAHILDSVLGANPPSTDE
jgi:hypothetical protein